MASSRIEGLAVGGRRLLRADAVRQLGVEVRNVTAAEILANIDAMVWGVASVAPGGPITTDALLEVHRRLLAGSPIEQHGGSLRSAQNWIGGSGYNPCSAEFVPPPPDAMPALLGDLLAFCNDDGLPALAQAAIAHAQFETIHPFVDGNGRTRRALIHLVLRRRGMAAYFLPSVSLILTTWADEHVAGLTATRYIGDPRRKPPTPASTVGWRFSPEPAVGRWTTPDGSRNGSASFSRTGVNARATRSKVPQRGRSSARCPQPRRLW